MRSHWSVQIREAVTSDTFKDTSDGYMEDRLWQGMKGSRKGKKKAGKPVRMLLGSPKQKVIKSESRAVAVKLEKK